MRKESTFKIIVRPRHAGVRTGGTPAVLHKEVRFLRFEIGAVSNSENTMIDGSTAATLIVRNDTGFVKLEDKLTCLDSNTDWLHGNGRNQGILVAGWNVDESLYNGSGDVRAIRHAHRVALGNVRIVSLRAETSGLFIEFECILTSNNVCVR